MKNLLLWLMLIFAINTLPAQRIIKGTVTDEDGLPLIGATIVAKGNKKGAITDLKGNYTLELLERASTLQFSYMGFSSVEVEIGATNVIDVSMKEGILLEEAIVTALGISRSEKSLPYSVQKLDEQQLTTIPQTNLNAALTGKIAGIQVRNQSNVALGRNAQVRIRGAGSLNDKAPLYVVDGTPTHSLDINVYDIDEVSVLKGPNATALYGQRGDAGVIVITTKQGRQNKGLGVDFNSNTIVERVYILPEYQNQYAGGGASDLIRFDWKEGMPQSWKSLDGKYYHDSFDDASWGPRMEGQEYIPWYAWYPDSPEFGQTAKLLPQADNVRQFWETGHSLVNNLAITKGDRQYALRLSFTNENNKGILPNATQNKNTVALNTRWNLNPKLSVGANLNLINQRLNGEFNDDYANQSTGSFSSWFHRDLDIRKLKQYSGLRSPGGVLASWNKNNPGVYPSEIDTYGGNYWYNFYSYFDLIDNSSQRDRYFGNLSLAYDITPELSIKGVFRRNQNRTNWDNKGPTILEGSAFQSGFKAYYSTGNTYFREDNLEILATYQKRFGDLTYTLNAGGNLREDNWNSFRSNTRDGLIVPDLFSLANSRTSAVPTSTRGIKKVRSLYAFGSFGYRDMLYLDWTARNDWSSALPIHDNAYFYPSVGSSFVFSELMNWGWLSFGKVRAGWAQVGSDLGAYQSALSYSVGSNQWNGNLLMTTPNTLIDENIRPALSSSFEVGLELRILQNRLGVDLTYYDENKIDEILTVPISGTSGYSSKRINAGRVEREGLEVTLKANPVETDKFHWDLTINLAHNTSQIIELAEGVNSIVIGGSYWRNIWGASVVHAVGEEWGQLRGNGIRKTDAGVPILSDDGGWQREPDVNFGSVLPDYTGGLFNTLRYGPVQLDFHLDFQKGGQLYSLTKTWGTFSGLLAETAATNDRGKNIRDPVAEGGGVHMIGVDEEGAVVDQYVEGQDFFSQQIFRSISETSILDLSYVKLRELSLSYSVPASRMKSLPWVQSARLALVARNPWLVWAAAKAYLDPGEASYLFGEHSQFPSTRSLGFSINLKF